MTPANQLILIICACVVGQVASFLNVANVPCGVRQQLRVGRIKGGVDASPGEFPWLVSIRVTGESGPHYCGGSLIHKRFVLTAAHCVQKNAPKYVAVVAGEHNLREPNSVHRQVLQVKEIISHANFSKRYINDIALLELKKEALWGKFVQPLCLPDRQADDFPNALNVTVAGWGMTDEVASGGKPSEVLQKVVVQVLPRADCQDWYRNETGKQVVLYDTHICAGFEKGLKDACQGDSGGPLLTTPDRAGRSVMAGVVSTGIGCGRPKLPGLYTRVSRYIDWIADKLQTRGVTVAI